MIPLQGHSNYPGQRGPSVNGNGETEVVLAPNASLIRETVWDCSTRPRVPAASVSQPPSSNTPVTNVAMTGGFDGYSRDRHTHE